MDHTLKLKIIRIVRPIITQGTLNLERNIPTKAGLAMGAPTSSILSEIYMQYMENTTIYDSYETQK
jgi:hypothetical protein